MTKQLGGGEARRGRGARTGVLLGMLVGLGCQRTPPTVEPEAVDNEPHHEVHADDDTRVLELAAIADAIDPGPQPALLEGMPGWILLAAGLPEELPTDPVALLHSADDELAAYEKGSWGHDSAILLQVLTLARAGAYAELAAAQGAVDIETLARLERVYDMLDAPMINGHGLFGQLLQTFVQMAAAQGLIDDAHKIDELGNAVFSAIQRAGPLHRHTVAELLRRAPDHEAVPRALAAAAQAVRAEDDALAVRMAKLSVEMRGDDVEPGQLLALANLCHEALDLQCGGRALARAEMLAEHASSGAKASETAFANAVRTATMANRAVELKKAEGFDDRLERARAVMALGRWEDAKLAFERLRRDFPEDARPVGGLAKLAVSTRLDMFGASAIIDGAGPLKNGDADYYQLAIGTRATVLVSNVLPAMAEGSWDEAMRALLPLMSRMRADIAAYEKLGATDARYLRFVQTMVEEILPPVRSGDDAALTAVWRSLLKRAMDLQAEIPDNAHALRLMLAATQFCDDEALAIAALDRPLPADAGELRLRWLQGWRDLAVTWNDPALAERLATEVGRMMQGEAPPKGIERVAADALAIRMRLGGAADWPAVVAAYDAIIGDPTTSTDASALNNLGVALAEAKDLDAARRYLDRAVEAGGDWSEMAQLNRAIVLRRPEDVAAVAVMVESGERDVIRLAAAAWMVELAPDAKAKRAANKALAKLVKTERPKHLRPRVTPGVSGITLEGKFEAGLGYSTNNGLEIKLDSAGPMWMTFPPPGKPF